MSGASRLPRLTIDTNNVISGTISPGNYSSQLLRRFLKDGAFHWIHTPQTFHELQKVLVRDEFKTRYGFEEESIHTFLETVFKAAEFITPQALADLPIHCRDEKDDIFLACALGGSCDFLITNDNDLLILNGEKTLGNLQIITAETYLRHQG
jgi:uncharacterized protein